VDKRASCSAVGGKIAGRSIFEAFDDRLLAVRHMIVRGRNRTHRLSGSIVANDQRERRKEFDGSGRLAKRPNAFHNVSKDVYCHAIECTHPVILNFSMVAMSSSV
jgi:hypothetical protein